jgi:hypothetical protein
MLRVFIPEEQGSEGEDEGGQEALKKGEVFVDGVPSWMQERDMC